MSASPKQRDMIESLFIEKGVDEATREKTRVLMNRADAQPKKHISPIIDGLMKLPKVEKPEAAAGLVRATAKTYPGVGAVNTLLRDKDIRVAKYAIPTEDLPLNVSSFAHGNSHLHVEVAEFKETRYVRVLRGAPGAFSREKIPNFVDVRDLVSVLVHPADQLRYTQIFGDTYSCCGVCGAELTDDTSKALKLGPVCRTRFGL